MNVVHIVDDVQYIETNCYQHQLTKALRSNANNIRTVSLFDLKGQTVPRDTDSVVCCLKQRTIHREYRELEWYLGDAPVVTYDQDPWESYKDDSPFKGTYDKLKNLNLKGIAVTTQWWAQRIKEFGLPGEFVKMGMLPQYCDVGKEFSSRNTQIGFIGGLHPRRQKLFNELSSMGINVSTSGNTLGYTAYLTALQDIGIFIHNEDTPIVVNGEPDNMGKGMWIKDVEASARGCFCVRNNEDGASSYCDNIPTIKLYDNVEQIPEIIDEIVSMDPEKRHQMMVQSVDMIKKQNAWKQTAERLIELGSR